MKPSVAYIRTGTLKCQKTIYCRKCGAEGLSDTTRVEIPVGLYTAEEVRSFVDRARYEQPVGWTTYCGNHNNGYLTTYECPECNR